MDHNDLIRRFESGTLEPFHHADHVHVAFSYLRSLPVLEALDRFAVGLKRFALSKGKSQLYNETVTYAYFFLINEQMARYPDLDWDDFARENPKLLTWKDSILTRYYRPETLQSDLARRLFIFPDNF